MFDDSACLPVRPLAKHLNYGMPEQGLHKVSGIYGLYYSPGFLDDDEQHDAVKHIDANQWRKDLGQGRPRLKTTDLSPGSGPRQVRENGSV